MSNKEEIEKLAMLFHNTYESLAPKYGYKTRLETRVFDKESDNGKLMIAVCEKIFNQKLKESQEKKYNEKGEIVEKPKHYEQFLKGKIREGSMAFIVCEKYHKSKTAQEQIQSLSQKIEEQKNGETYQITRVIIKQVA